MLAQPQAARPQPRARESHHGRDPPGLQLRREGARLHAAGDRRPDLPPRRPQGPEGHGDRLHVQPLPLREGGDRPADPRRAATSQALGVNTIAISSNDAADLPGRQLRQHAALGRGEGASRSSTSTTRARRSPAPTMPSARPTSSATTPSSGCSIAAGSTSRRRRWSPDARRELFEAMRQVAETGQGPEEQIAVAWAARSSGSTRPERPRARLSRSARPGLPALARGTF